jgi:hypothetical protein
VGVHCSGKSQTSKDDVCASHRLLFGIHDSEVSQAPNP